MTITPATMCVVLDDVLDDSFSESPEETMQKQLTPAHILQDKVVKIYTMY